jgi:hypothetical protein
MILSLIDGSPERFGTRNDPMVSFIHLVLPHGMAHAKIMALPSTLVSSFLLVLSIRMARTLWLVLSRVLAHPCTLVLTYPSG